MYFATRGEMATFEVDNRLLERPTHWVGSTIQAADFRRGLKNRSARVYLADRITPAIARQIREAGGWYADAGGNMYLRAPGVLIDVSGRVPAADRKPAPPDATPHNLMSAGRAQVVLAVLTWPHLLSQSLREIAQAAGVSTAAAHKTMKLLEGRYLTTSRQLVRRDELIDLWASAYPLGLARSTEVGRYRGEPDPGAWLERGHRVYVSGEYAVDELRGPDLVLYVPELDTKALIRSRWRRPEPGDQANIIVRKAFWTEPGRWDEVAPGIEAAPELLIYGDLLASNDPRQREIANAMRRAL